MWGCKERLEAKVAPGVVPVVWTTTTEGEDSMESVMLGEWKFNKLCWISTGNETLMIRYWRMRVALILQNDSVKWKKKKKDFCKHDPGVYLNGWSGQHVDPIESGFDWS